MPNFISLFSRAFSSNSSNSAWKPPFPVGTILPKKFPLDEARMAVTLKGKIEIQTLDEILNTLTKQGVEKVLTVCQPGPSTQKSWESFSDDFKKKWQDTPNAPGCSEEAVAFAKKLPEFQEQKCAVVFFNLNLPAQHQLVTQEKDLTTMRFVSLTERIAKEAGFPLALTTAGNEKWLYMERFAFLMNRVGKVIAFYPPLPLAELGKNPDRILDSLDELFPRPKPLVFHAR